MLRANAFTLIELLVVIAVLGLLISILLPSLSAAQAHARTVKCLGNLHAMAVAASTYTTEDPDGSYPIAYTSGTGEAGDEPGGGSGGAAASTWDFTTRRDGESGETVVEPGLLWNGIANPRVQQCPSFRGSANWLEDPYTGYNYNTSYIGHGVLETIPSPARAHEVRSPGECALFGDGEYSGGANKFMRSPDRAPGDVRCRARYAGTQGYRHSDSTNVAFADGHCQSWAARHEGRWKGRVAEGTGFLSEDNNLYDLK